MNATENPNKELSKGGSVPGWVALIIALIFWVILLPLFHAGIP